MPNSPRPPNSLCNRADDRENGGGKIPTADTLGTTCPRGQCQFEASYYAASNFDTGANPVLVAVGERERLIPFVIDQYVKSVDFDAGLVVVDWDADF